MAEDTALYSFDGAPSRPLTVAMLKEAWEKLGRERVRVEVPVLPTFRRLVLHPDDLDAINAVREAEGVRPLEGVEVSTSCFLPRDHGVGYRWGRYGWELAGIIKLKGEGGGEPEAADDEAGDGGAHPQPVRERPAS